MKESPKPPHVIERILVAIESTPIIEPSDLPNEDFTDLKAAKTFDVFHEVSLGYLDDSLKQHWCYMRSLLFRTWQLQLLAGDLCSTLETIRLSRGPAHNPVQMLAEWLKRADLVYKYGVGLQEDYEYVDARFIRLIENRFRVIADGARLSSWPRKSPYIEIRKDFRVVCCSEANHEVMKLQAHPFPDLLRQIERAKDLNPDWLRSYESAADIRARVSGIDD